MQNKKREVRLFDSFEAAAEADAKAMAAKTGEEHLRDAVKLIKAVYGEKWKKPMNKRLGFR